MLFVTKTNDDLFHCFSVSHNGLFHLNCLHGPRLAVRMILEGAWGDLVGVLAPVCSSFSAPNRGTAARDILSIWGNFFHPSVASGNKMMSRSGVEKMYLTFLVLLIVA